MEIYLLNGTKSKGVENLILNKIKFSDFNINLKDFDTLVLASKNAVKALGGTKIKLNFTLQVYAVGEKTAKEVKKLGFTEIEAPSLAYGRILFDEFKDELKRQKCLYLRGRNTALKLNEDLQSYGVELKEVITYENALRACKIKPKQPAVFILTSPHSVLNFFKFYETYPEGHFIAMGQSTAENLKGLRFNLTKGATIKAYVDLARPYKTLLRQD